MTAEAYLTRDDDRTTLTPDVVKDISFSFSVKVTENPVEDGSTVSDNAQPQNETITLTAMVSATPIKGQQKNTSLTGAARLRAARDWLERAKGAVVTLTSKTMGVKNNCLVRNVRFTVDTKERIDFKIELRQVIFSSASAVFITEANVAEAEESAASIADEVDIGEQGTTSTDTDPVAEEQDKSYLAEIVDAI